jgi:hypothetical protein
VYYKLARRLNIIRNSGGRLERPFRAKPGTFYGTLRDGTEDIETEVTEDTVNEDENRSEKWSGRVDLNHAREKATKPKK